MNSFNTGFLSAYDMPGILGAGNTTGYKEEEVPAFGELHSGDYKQVNIQYYFR